MEEKITNVSLPFFYGFYETWYGDAIDNEIEIEIDYLEREDKKTYTFEDFDIDYPEYMQKVVECFVEIFSDWFKPNWVKEINLSYLYSPREYNFETDEIISEIVLDDNWVDELNTFIKEHKGKLIELVRKENTSRDGFHSFLPNEFDEWCEWLFAKKDGRVFSQMLQWYIETNENREWCDIGDEIESEVLEDIEASEFFRLKEETLA